MVDIKLMRITAVCSNCIHNNSDPNIEINFSEQSIYYMCPKCKKESKISLQIQSKPFAKSHTLK